MFAVEFLKQARSGKFDQSGKHLHQLDRTSSHCSCSDTQAQYRRWGSLQMSLNTLLVHVLFDVAGLFTTQTSDSTVTKAHFRCGMVRNCASWMLTLGTYLFVRVCACAGACVRVRAYIAYLVCCNIISLTQTS